MSIVDYELVFAQVPSWTSVEERETLARLAEQAPEGCHIVEIGALYGGMTAVMGIANPTARITVIDDFSWSPIPERPAGKAELLRNVTALGVTNVTVLDADSREIGRTWNQPIELLWIDGGHSYEFVHADLVNFAPWAQVVALHDYDNPFWPSIRQAVEDYLRDNPGWEIREVVEMVVVLQRTPLPAASPHLEEHEMGGRSRQ